MGPERWPEALFFSPLGCPYFGSKPVPMKRYPLSFYLSFSRSERTGILGLFALVVLAWFLPTLFPEPDPPVFIPVETIRSGPAPRVTLSGPQRTGPDEWSTGPNRDSLFPFDPNTLTASGWKSLGLREKTIQTILNFREKGARFSTAADLSRIYGLGKEEYERLRPWVRIPGRDKTFFPASKAEIGEKNPFPGQGYSSKPVVPFGINSSDTSQWIALPGIGSKLAARILAYREKLGGFYKVEQVKEVYGITDSVFEKIRPRLKPEPDLVRKMDLNTTDNETFRKHPYFRDKLARLLPAYIRQHGPVSRLEELQKIPTLTEDVLEKLRPYLRL